MAELSETPSLPLADKGEVPTLDYALPRKRSLIPRGALQAGGSVMATLVFARTVYGTLWSVSTYFLEQHSTCGTVRMYAHGETNRLQIWLLLAIVGVVAAWRVWQARMIALIAAGGAMGTWWVLHAALDNRWPFR